MIPYTSPSDTCQIAWCPKQGIIPPSARQQTKRCNYARTALFSNLQTFIEMFAECSWPPDASKSDHDSAPSSWGLQCFTFHGPSERPDGFFGASFLQLSYLHTWHSVSKPAPKAQQTCSGTFQIQFTGMRGGATFRTQFTLKPGKPST